VPRVMGTAQKFTLYPRNYLEWILLHSHTTRMVTLQSVLDVLASKNCDSKNVLNVYQFGSRVYNCHNDQSDWDFIVIVEGNYFDEFKILEVDEINITLIHIESFKKLVLQGTKKMI
jgi:predicted nucleotidyltransferase